MSYADELLEELHPYVEADPAGGLAATAYIEGVAEMAEPYATLVRDSDERPGWADLFDPDRCPEELLWIPAQLAGVRLAPTDPVAVQRLKISAGDGMHRGTVEAQVLAAQLTLTGTKTVIVQERFTSAWNQRFITRPAETPDAAATLAALKSQKPIGIVTFHEVFDGLTWADIAARSGGTYTWGDLWGHYLTWDDARLDNPI